MTALKLAETLFAASIVTTQVVEALAHAPPQPPNVLFWPGVAVSVTVVPDTSEAEHVPGQSMPPTLDVTDPVPVPPVVTVSVKLGGSGGSNVAVTLRAALIVTVQLPVPEQPLPLHPAKVLPFVGVAVSVTAVPAV
jgi:hypothetical protein